MFMENADLSVKLYFRIIFLNLIIVVFFYQFFLDLEFMGNIKDNFISIQELDENYKIDYNFEFFQKLYFFISIRNFVKSMKYIHENSLTCKTSIRIDQLQVCHILF